MLAFDASVGLSKSQDTMKPIAIGVAIFRFETCAIVVFRKIVWRVEYEQIDEAVGQERNCRKKVLIHDSICEEIDRTRRIEAQQAAFQRGLLFAGTS